MNCSNGKIFEEIVLTGGKIGYLYFRDTLTTEDVTAPAGTRSPPTSMPLPPALQETLGALSASDVE